MITKQQFERFNQHFTVREAVTVSAEFDLNVTFDKELIKIIKKAAKRRPVQ